MARSKGYRDYYEYRVLYRSGQIPPGGVPVPAGERRRARGHGGRADFLAAIRPGFTVSLLVPVSSVEVVLRRRKVEGRWRRVSVYPRIDKLLIDNRGEGRTYKLRNLARAQLVATIREEERKGAVFVPAPSLDQRRLVSDVEAEGGY